MEKSFSLSSLAEVLHGDYFSIFVDESLSYWVVSNDYPSVFKGPCKLDSAFKLMSYSNDFVNLLKSKGLL